MLRIGLTGGIASGKSEALRRFAELGAVAIDHDVLAREVVAPGTVGLDAVVAEFGEEVLRPDGELDRPALGRIVFADDDARERLNAIVHPEVRRVAAEREAKAAATAPDVVVVHDIPLLVEVGQADRFHVLVVVDAPADLRLRRLVEGRGMSEDEARGRIAAQVDDDVRRAAADVVLDGTGTPEQLREQVDALWERIAAERVAEREAEQLT